MIIKGIIIENSAVTLLAQIVDAEGDFIQRADVAAIGCKVFDDSGELVASPTINVADAIHDTLQTDRRWGIDDTGYNLAAGLSGSNFPTGNTTYRVEIKITPVDGDAFYLVFDLRAVNIYSE